MDVLVNSRQEMRGMWISFRETLKTGICAGTVTVFGAWAQIITEAVQEVQAAATDKAFARMVQESSDTLYNALDESIENIFNHSATA